MNKYFWLLLINIICINAFSQTTRSLVTEVNLDSLVKTVREFSGEDSTLVNDSLVHIQHRVSKKGNNLAADYLVDRMLALGLKVETIDYRKSGRNVVGTLVGKTKPDSVFIISAHYDAVADYCADDNASGSATVLEAARIMSKYCFQNTIKFAFWDEEELGLIGSRYYADSAIARGDHISGVMNMDMMGYDGDSNKVFDIHTNSNPENQVLKDTILFILDTLNIDLVPKVINPGTTRSDHAAFWKHRYPAVFCGESFIGGDPNPAYHSSKDRISLFDLNYYHKLAQLAIGTMVELTGVIPTVVEKDTVTACYEYAYKDTTFYTSTMFRDSIKTADDCDSIYELHLTVLPVFETTDSITVCHKYEYRDKNYSQSGVYHDTLTARNGCDSVYTFVLTVLPILQVTDTIVVCENYTYRGNTIELSGIYRDTLTSRFGCDSIYTFVLTVLPVFEITGKVDACDAYVYRGKEFKESTIYRDTLISRNGCDSIYTLDLTIKKSTYIYDIVKSCGDYTYRNQIYTTSGLYHDTLMAQNGCDSVYSFDLQIIRINDSIYRGTNTLTAFDTTTSYQWVRCSGTRRIPMFGAVTRNWQPPLDDFYAVILNKNQCIDTSDCILARLSNVSSIDNSNTIVYPNPTTNDVEIDFMDLVKAVEIQTFTSSGQLVGIHSFSNLAKCQVQIPHRSGVYYLKIRTENGVVIKKVIKVL